MMLLIPSARPSSQPLIRPVPAANRYGPSGPFHSGRCAGGCRRRGRDRRRKPSSSSTQEPDVSVARVLVLFALAALAEIGGAWLIWQGARESRGVVWLGAGVVTLGAYGFLITLQDDNNFGRILAAYGGLFVAASLAWGIVVDGFRPDRWDYLGSAICLVGVAVIMLAPRP